ncbi:hypothetical protein DJ021_13740 [Phenylobacterium hankyongense]|uniref:Uncharacterized protein n=1 Tax=Phenylobacterium hankyongense TaxID=1813876 RepID=A0A328B0V3_9CAUL|nr:hypothetical protein [Phenylobacterium hankyongense]RAK60793.1 hypothetical protein DJ021_13740 [Phenylobacterium hankyongense]
MRLFLFAMLLSLWAGAARAETWRILHWDRFSLIAVDPEHRRTTGLGNPALPVLQLKLYPTASDVEAQVGEEEVDCAEQRARTRTRQQFFGVDQQTGIDTEIQPWRDPGEERDRLLVRSLCDPHGLDAAPSVTATSLQEARRAHLTAARTPKSLGAMPAWSAAWNALAAGRGPDAIPSIELAVQSQHPFVVAAIDDAGSAILLSIDIEKVGDMRYRFHEAQVGAQLRGDVAATWALREADCGQRRLRNLAWAGFDARIRKKFGYDTNDIGTSFETPPAGTTDEVVLRDVCGATRLIAGMRAVTSDLAGAITAYRWLLEGDDAAAKGLRDADSWRAAYAQACGTDCAPRAGEPAGSTVRSWPKGSHS